MNFIFVYFADALKQWLLQRKKTTERQYIRSRVTKLISSINDQNIASLPAASRAASVAALQAKQAELTELNKAVYMLKVDEGASEAALDALLDADDEYDQKIAICLHNLSGMSASSFSLGGTSSASFGQTTTAPYTTSRVPLPKLELPTFANKREESLSKFFDTFEAILSKSGSTDRELFLYLKNQLSGGPKVLIDSLGSNEESYATAKELLTKAFENTSSIKFSLLQRLSELKMKRGSDPYAFIGELRSIINGMDTHKVELKDVQQYFAWNAMNQDFQSQLIGVTNTSKPSLDQIMETIFDATERYQRFIETKPDARDNKNFFYKSEKPPQSAAMAVEVKAKKTYCGLCKYC